MKNEGAFWSAVRERLHVPPFAVCRKLTDAFTAGTPDAFYVHAGITTYLELKYAPRWPVRADTVLVGLTPDQRMYLELLRGVGAPAWVLLGVERDVLLLEPGIIPNDQRVHTTALGTGAPGVRFRGRLPDLAAALIRLADEVLGPGAAAYRAGGGAGPTGDGKSF